MARELDRQLRQQCQSLPVLAWSPGLVIPAQQRRLLPLQPQP